VRTLKRGSDLIAAMSPTGTGASSTSPFRNARCAPRAGILWKTTVSPVRLTTTRLADPETSENGPGRNRGAVATEVST
jgi:hypothetical protein